MSGWGGARVTRARAAWALRLPVPCSRCGRDVTPDQAWQLDHLTARAIDPAATWTTGNLWPAHRRCNESAGGRLGARRRWGARMERRDTGPPSRPW